MPDLSHHGYPPLHPAQLDVGQPVMLQHGELCTVAMVGDGKVVVRHPGIDGSWTEIVKAVYPRTTEMRR